MNYIPTVPTTMFPVTWKKKIPQIPTNLLKHILIPILFCEVACYLKLGCIFTIAWKEEKWHWGQRHQHYYSLYLLQDVVEGTVLSFQKLSTAQGGVLRGSRMVVKLRVQSISLSLIFISLQIIWGKPYVIINIRPLITWHTWLH